MILYFCSFIAVSLCTCHLSKTYPSFLTVKEGSTSHLGLLPSGKKRETALRCSKPLRSKVGGPSKVFARLCGMGPPYYSLLIGRMGMDGWDHQNSSSLQYRSALVVARMRNIVFILFLTGLPLGRFPSRLWRKSYDRHWRLMNDHNDRGCHL